MKKIARHNEGRDHQKEQKEQMESTEELASYDFSCRQLADEDKFSLPGCFFTNDPCKKIQWDQQAGGQLDDGGNRVKDDHSQVFIGIVVNDEARGGIENQQQQQEDANYIGITGRLGVFFVPDCIYVYSRQV